LSRLLLRLVLAILVVVVASFFIARWGFEQAGQRFFEEIVPRVTADIEKARKQLEGVPKERFNQELKKVAQELGYEVKILPRGSSKVPHRVRRQLRRGRPFAFSGRRGKYKIFVPLGRGRGLARFKPPAYATLFPLGMVAGSILAVTTLTAFLLAFPMVRRLRRLEQAAQRISEGELQARAEVSSRDAFGSLARRFNLMADRVQQLLQSQRQLIRAVSHELRTPLARMRFDLELLSQAEEQEEQARRAASMEEDLDELEQLIQELLTYIKAGDRALELDREAVATGPLILELIPKLLEHADGVNVTLEPESDEGLPALDADPRHLRRAVKNLLENAARHCHKVVVVRREAREGTLRISVCDDGPGIPPDQRQLVLEPFARLDQSRDRGSGGVGLGLAIVREIAGAHGGTLEVGDAPEGGAAFTLVWPT